MNDQESFNHSMTLGMFAGIYMVTSILAEKEPEWQHIKASTAADIQRLSGMPAEDFANIMDGLISKVRGDIENTRDGNA